MRLTKIYWLEIDRHPDNYNSNFHTALETPHHSIPDETPQSFSRWLHLIASSQAIPTSSIQTIILSQAQRQLILDASANSLHTREPSRIYTEELYDLATSEIFTSLVFPSEGLFLRLDECSPKDGVRGTAPLRSVTEILLRLTTSHRATNAMLRQRSKGGTGTQLILLPFSEKMDTEKEFRVFCAPPDGRITGVSQYKWHAASVFTLTRTAEEVDALMRLIMDQIRGIHHQILGEAKKGEGGEMDKLLLKQGFSFDVMFEEEAGRCMLIELNSFGARSGCGSCLFHWLRDEAVLYGTGADVAEVEFRISASTMVKDPGSSEFRKGEVFRDKIKEVERKGGQWLD